MHAINKISEKFAWQSENSYTEFSICPIHIHHSEIIHQYDTRRVIHTRNICEISADILRTDRYECTKMRRPLCSPGRVLNTMAIVPFQFGQPFNTVVTHPRNLRPSAKREYSISEFLHFYWRHYRRGECEIFARCMHMRVVVGGLRNLCDFFYYALSNFLLLIYCWCM